MKHKHLPQLYGVVKDYHPRMIPENKVADCDNVIFRQGRVRRRYGYATLGPDHLNGAISGIAYYEQVRLGNRYTLVFTSRNAYLYDTTTGTFTPIAQSYNTGTARSNCLSVTGVGSTWLPASWTLNDTYQIKFGTNSTSRTAVNFTATASQFASFGAAVYNMRSAALSSTSSIVVYDNGTTSYARVVTYSGGTFTAGAATSIGTGTAPQVGVYSSTVAVVTYRNGSDVCRARGCSISGTTITLGTDIDSGIYYDNNGFSYSVLFLSSSDVVFSGHRSSGSSYYSYCTLSGTTLTYVDNDTSMGDLANESVLLAKLSSTDFVAFFRRDTGDYYSVHLSISTGVLVKTSTTLFSPTPTHLYSIDDCVAISSTRMLILSRSSTGCPYISLVNYDSGVYPFFTIVTSLQLTTGTGRYRGDLKAIDSSHYMVIENYSGIRSRLITVSGDTLTNANTTTLKTLGSLYTSQSVACAVLSTTTGLFFFGDGSASYYGKGTPLTIDISADTIALGGASTVLTSPSALTNLYVGLELTATFLQSGTRIKSIDWAGSTITIDRPITAEATGGSISADVSVWYTIHSVDSATGITLNAVSTFIGNTTNSSAVVSGIASTSGLHVGMGLSGSGIPSNAYILSIDSSTQITMSAAATATATGVTISTGVVITSSHEVNYVISLCFNGDDDDYWSFAYPYLSSVGDKILVASNGIDPILKWTGSGSVSNLGGSPPVTAKYIGYFGASMYEHFIAAWTTDSGNNLPQTIEVSDAGNPESWSGTYYDLLQKNDEIIGMEILKNRLVIYKNKSISLCYPTPEGGNSDPFDLDQDVIIDIEIPVGRTVVNFGDYHLFLGMDNVYRFNGIGLEPIGTEVINTMKNEWNGAFMHHAFAFTIPSENLYCIFIPTLELRDENNNVIKQESEYPDKAYVYNYVEGTWSIWTFPVNPTTLISQQFTCAGFVTKLYAPTVADIDALNQTYADMNMRWSDLIAYSNIQSLLLGDNNGYIYEMRDVYDDDNGTVIAAAFTTRDYALNDPKHTFMLLEAVVGMARRLTGTIQIRASVDFGETWSAWVPVVQAGGAEYVEYIANFIQKGLQVRFEVGNVAGADFEVESIMIGYNDEMGKKK